MQAHEHQSPIPAVPRRRMHDDLSAKTAIGVWQWRPDECVGQIRLPGCVPSVDLPELSVAEGWERGARTLLVGVVNRGGVFSQDWIDTMVAALQIGMDRRERAPRPPRRHPGRGGGRAARGPDPARRAAPRGLVPDRNRRAAERAPPPHRRHGLLGGQDVHDALPAARARSARGRRPTSGRPGRPASSSRGREIAVDAHRLGLHVRGHGTALPGRPR